MTANNPHYFITTAIDYPNSRPHIGTAFEKIGADVQARFRRMEGYSVHFLMGNDENTIKVPQRARELGVEPKQYVDDMARQFQEVWRRARHLVRRIHPDQRAERITPAVRSSSRRSSTRATSTKGSIRAITATAARRSRPKRKSRKETATARFTRVRRWSGSRKTITSSASRPIATGCWPTTQRIRNSSSPRAGATRSINLVETELRDIAITRKGFTWGIKVPFDPEQTIYVWFDALLNYITGIGYGTDDERFRQTWPADVHVIGKDITRFHCALWPAMLMSAGIALPERVFGHGFVYRKNEETGEVQKLCKTLGNVVEPMELIDKFSAEAFRYYFMSQCPFGGDGEFSFERFADNYNSGLANNLGNNYSRILTMCLKYFDGRLENAAAVEVTQWRRGLDLAELVGSLRASIGSFDYSASLQCIWRDVIDAANRYIDETKPFKLAKTDLDGCRAVLINLAEWLRVAAILIKPFLPRTAETFYRAFNFEEVRAWDQVSYNDAAAPQLPPVLTVTAPNTGGKPAPLFPKIEAR